jgi:hypothetical protein
MTRMEADNRDGEGDSADGGSARESRRLGEQPGSEVVSLLDNAKTMG